MLGPPDPGTVRRVAAARARVAPLDAMLKAHWRFTHSPTGAEFRQPHINPWPWDRFTVIRPDGERREFRYRQLATALDFAEGVEAPERIAPENHPLRRSPGD